MKKLIILLVSVLGFNVYAADYLGTITDYRYAVRRDLNVDSASTAYLSDTALNQIIRGAIVTIMPVIQGDKSEDTILTTRNTMRYALDSTCLSVTDVEWRKTDSGKGLNFVKRGQWYEQKHRTTSNTFDPYKRRPSFWDSDDDYLYVSPTPSINNDTLLIQYIRKVPSIATASSLSMIPQAYRPAVLAWASYVAARTKQRADKDIFLRDFIMVAKNVNNALNQRGMPPIAIPDN